jgi:hypothetical protein
MSRKVSVYKDEKVQSVSASDLLFGGMPKVGLEQPTSISMSKYSTVATDFFGSLAFSDLIGL